MVRQSFPNCLNGQVLENIIDNDKAEKLNVLDNFRFIH